MMMKTTTSKSNLLNSSLSPLENKKTNSQTQPAQVNKNIEKTCFDDSEDYLYMLSQKSDEDEDWESLRCNSQNKPSNTNAKKTLTSSSKEPIGTVKSQM
jgi:hypothetical protein